MHICTYVLKCAACSTFLLLSILKQNGMDSPWSLLHGEIFFLSNMMMVVWEIRKQALKHCKHRKCNRKQN